MMSAPSRARWIAWLRPWPRAAPVMSATLPATRSVISVSLPPPRGLSRHGVASTTANGRPHTAQVMPVRQEPNCRWSRCLFGWSRRRLGDGPRDLQRDQLVLGLAELPQDLVGVLGELGRAPADDGRLVELDRVRDQLAFSALVICHGSHEPVLPQRGIHPDLVGVLDQGPLALGPVHQVAPLLQR